MNAASTLLSAGIATVLVLSAVGKLRSLHLAGSTLQSLRVPQIAPRTTIIGLALVELCVAVALFLPVRFSRIGAIVATVLMLCFLAVVVRAYWLGSREDCGCFGAHSSAISMRLILRNSALLASAALLTVLTWTGADAFRALTGVDRMQALIVLLAGALLAVILWLSMDQHHGAAVEDSQPTDGRAPAQPHVVLLEQRRRVPRDISAATAWRAQLLVFVKPGCSSCEEVMSELRHRHETIRGVVDASTVISAPTGQDLPAGGDDDQALLDLADQNARAIGVGERRPVAVLIGTDGSVVRPFARGRDQIVELLDVLEHTTR